MYLGSSGASFLVTGRERGLREHRIEIRIESYGLDYGREKEEEEKRQFFTEF
jgi:hypothetical protein